MSRPLTEAEAAVIERIVDQLPEPTRHQLRAQIPATHVVSGLPTFPHLDAGSSASVRGLQDGPLPVRAYVIGDNDQFEGELLVWVEGGRLSALEYAWITDEPPAIFPPPARLQFEKPK